MAKVKSVSLNNVYHHDRGWGYEKWIENLPDYCGKMLVLAKGKKGSMHYHMKKLETMFLIEGSVVLSMIDAETGNEYAVQLNKWDSIRIERGQAHQIIAIEDSKLIEFSTTHEEKDSYRVRKGD